MNEEARKRALTVFIGDYPENSGWSNIHSLNDKTIILNSLETVGFQANDIICLENSAATRNAIDDAFESLILACRPGDIVYIHFSCHGQLITDANGDETLRDARDRYDESLVPYDAAVEYGKNGYDGAKHLVDDAVNEYLCGIEDKVGKKGSVLVVFDACHSGDARREYSDDVDVEYVRGFAQPFELPSTGKLLEETPREAKCVTISACRDFESNYECKIGGVMYGRLWKKDVLSVLDEILREVTRLRCGMIRCEENGDKGFLKKEINRRPGVSVWTKTYTESQNKKIKIETYLKQAWEHVRFLEGTDRAYIDQILDYTEYAEHDDAPDSAATMCRFFYTFHWDGKR